VERRRLAVVIPALNEGDSIGAVVAGIARDAIPVVVDDGSSDDTGQRALAAGAVVVRLPENQGYDAALNAGFAAANTLQCEFAMTMDADGQHDGAMVAKFGAALEAGADVVLGVRQRRQRLAEIVFALIASMLWEIRDPLCGMKGYRMDLYRELGHFDSYGSIGTELAIFAARRRKQIVEIPIITRERVGSPRFGRFFGANLRIFRALLIGICGSHKLALPGAG
jgi:glycosyltransferase involved in cell wall biosynthesis